MDVGGEAEPFAAAVGGVDGFLDEVALLEHADPAERGGGGHRGGDAAAGDRDAAAFLARDEQIEQDIARGIGEQVGVDIIAEPAARGEDLAREAGGARAAFGRGDGGVAQPGRGLAEAVGERVQIVVGKRRSHQKYPMARMLRHSVRAMIR